MVLNADAPRNEYEIHDNGGRPFVVKLDPNNGVTNVRVINNYENSLYFQDNECICYYPAYKVFVGKSLRNAMTEFSGGHGPRFDGNAMLFLIDENELKYLYVGKSIYTFKAISPITDFISSVGNSNVPYPYAIDEKSNTYIMLDSVIMLADQNPISELGNDPYDYYYRKQTMTEDLCVIPSRPALREYFGITEFYAGGEQYVCRLDIEPAGEYDRCIRDFGAPIEMTIDGVRQEITKERYIDLMTNTAAEMGFVPFMEKEVICKRNCIC